MVFTGWLDPRLCIIMWKRFKNKEIRIQMNTVQIAINYLILHLVGV